MKHTLKKSLALFLAVLMVVLCAPLVFAAGGTDGDITWSYDTSSQTLTISGNNSGQMNNYGTSGQYLPPWSSYKNEITKVVIDNYVSRIGSFAFYGFGKIETVEIGDSVMTIGTSAFNCCTSLKSVRIPDTVHSIGQNTFSGCCALEEVVISNNLTEIMNSTFEKCSALKKVTIPGSVASIGSQAFMNCYALESVTILPGVGSIDTYAFSDCALKKVFIPASVQSIGAYAFASGEGPDPVVYYGGSEEQWNAVDRKTTAFWVPDGNNWYRERTAEEPLTFRYNSNLAGNIIWCYDDATATLYIDGDGGMGDYNLGNHRPEWIGYSDRAKALVIGNGVTKPGAYAFYKFTALETVSIPDSVTELRDYAFEKCTSLKSVTIPDSVTKARGGEFRNCSSLEEVVISKNLTAISENMFNACSLLKNVTIPDSVKSVGYQAFMKCSSLETVTIGAGVETIGNYAFGHCSSLKSAVLPASLQTIGCYAFGGFPMETVYYCGSEAQWNAIQQDEDGNSFFLDNPSNNWYRERGEGEELNVVFYWGVSGTIKAIEDIGEVEYTAECKARIDEARKAYDRLSDYESTLVTNHQDLLDAEKAYSDLDAAAALAAAKTAAKSALDGYKNASDYRADEQTALAQAISDGKAAIDAAADADAVAAALAAAKAVIDDIKTDAELTAEEAAADAAAADAVEEKIAAIGEVAYTDESKALIDDAQNDYDALTDTQKALVENADVLTAAQEKYAELKAEAETPTEPDDGEVCPICGKTEHSNRRNEIIHGVIYVVLRLISEVIIPTAQLIRSL